MKKLTLILVILIVILIAAVFVRNAVGPLQPAPQPTATSTPNSAENAPPGSIHNLPLAEAVKIARTTLANKLKIDESKVLILTVYEKEWTDSCLGLGGIAESCLQAITPGYEVTMEANGKTYIYRTNESGSAVREFTN